MNTCDMDTVIQSVSKSYFTIIHL